MDWLAEKDPTPYICYSINDDASSTWETAMRRHEARLVVGARVKIRLSAECEYCDRDGGDGLEGVIIDTRLDADTIEAANGDGIILGHHFRVRGDDMREDDWSGYCAAELVPIDDDQPLTPPPSSP